MDKDLSKYLIGAVGGVVIGGIFITAMRPATNPMNVMTPDNNSAQSAMTTKAIESKGMVRSLIQQHTAIAGDYLMKILKNEDTVAVRAGLEKNTQALADIFAQAYGDNLRSDFVSMWNGHITEYENYANATKNNNTDAKNKAKNNLMMMTDNMQKFISQLNTQPADKISLLMGEHVNGTLSLIDAAATKDNAKTVDLMDVGFKQAGTFGDYLFQIIYAEKPDMFK